MSDANLTEKVKTQKAIIRDCLAGANQRRKVDGWTPKWLAFPPATYAGRPLPALDRWHEVRGLAKTLPALEPALPPALAILPAGETPKPEPDADAPEYAIAAE